jgi:hypothetical protein
MTNVTDNPPREEQSVETTGLAWALRTSFRRYVQRVAMGREILDGGAGHIPDGRLYFPVKSVGHLDPHHGDVSVAFSGGVRFLGHLGMIDLRIGELDLHITGGEGRLRTGTTEGLRDLVDVRLARTQADDSGASLLLSSRLAPGAEDLFDAVYSAATPFDDLEIRLTVL